MKYSVKDIIIGALVFPAGDLIAAFITGDFCLMRLIGIILVGAIIYAFEIPNFFRWIEKTSSKYKGIKLSIYKTSLSTLYFNPLWISRHMALIMWFSGKSNEISTEIFYQGLLSFIFSLPITLAGNFMVQNMLHFKYRFFGSALFSVVMAVYYALSMEYL
ncbi:MAG: hypothetical protein JXR58_06355 [Bacteroidales bacterium]|nr:hypothetical protein [Bacteroidales bacterium]